MILARLIRTAVVFIVAGLAVAGIWVFFTGSGEYLNALKRANPLYLLPMFGLTVVYLFLRFVRWHYMLRRVGIKVPIRANLSVYLASLVGVATPAHLGELMRSVLMRQRFGTPVGLSATVLVYERLFDMAVLGVIGALTAPGGWLRGVMILLVVLVYPLMLGVQVVATRIDVGFRAFQQMHAPGTVLTTLAASAVIWLSAGLLLVMAGGSLGVGVSVVGGVGVFSWSTLLGGVTLMPAGVATTGSFAIIGLQSMDIGLADALAVVSLTRLASVGLALVISAVFCLIEFRHAKTPTIVQSDAHFDEIAEEYDAQFSDHVWNYLLDRKVTFMTDQFPRLPAPPKVGLDLGCGRGEQCGRLGQRGHWVVGLDSSIGLLRYAHRAGATVVNGDALRLPFGDGSLDYVYTIGVLHHLASQKDQVLACEEVVRVLKPGGLLMVHETNPRNPLFRFYMGYVFPLLKSIDMGNEIWIDPRWWPNVRGMKVADVVHFTFLPDFIPKALMKPLSRVERWLESGAARPYSVHYLAVLQKV